jgi:hypothetical protein
MAVTRGECIIPMKFRDENSNTAHCLTTNKQYGQPTEHMSTWPNISFSIVNDTRRPVTTCVSTVVGLPGSSDFYCRIITTLKHNIITITLSSGWKGLSSMKTGRTFLYFYLPSHSGRNCTLWGRSGRNYVLSSSQGQTWLHQSPAADVTVYRS